jgi:hypothetical protein
MNKNSSRQLIEAAVAKRAALETEISRMPSMVAANGTKLAKLVDTGDLSDLSVVDEIARCQALSVVLPMRQQLREDQFARADEEILSTCHAVIGDDLSPRAHRAAGLAHDTARKTLAAHFSDPIKLAVALENATLVQQAAKINWVLTIRGSPEEGAEGYAASIIKCIADLADFEARLQ